MTVAIRNKPKLSLEVGPLFDDQWTGIPVFTRRLAQALLRHGGVDLEFVFNQALVPVERVLNALRAGTGTFLREEFERHAGHGYPLSQGGGHVLYPSVKECFHVSPHEASTVHDLSTLFMPENHESVNVEYHMQNLAREIATDEVVFCVSEATRAALALAYPSAAGKTRLLYQYVDWPENFAAIERNLPAPALGRYAAVVGTLEPRKNLTLLLRALKSPEIAKTDLRFVVIGKKGWKIDEVLAGLTEAERERLIFSGFVSEFSKYRLLKHAEFLVFPSVYEGFGIPAIEAMSLGKPVLAALTSSFPEVIGEAGIFFDPLSVSEFAAGFGEISHRKRQAELAPKALAGAAAFDWQRMAAPVVDWLNAA